MISSLLQSLLLSLVSSFFVWASDSVKPAEAVTPAAVCEEEMKLVYTASVGGTTIRVCAFTDPLKVEKNQIMTEGFALLQEIDGTKSTLLSGPEEKRYKMNFAKSDITVTEYVTLNKDLPTFETNAKCAKGSCSVGSEKCIFKGYTRPSKKLTVKHMLSRESKPAEIQLLAGWALSGDVKAQKAFFELPATVQFSEESTEEFQSWKDLLVRLQKSKCLPRQ